MRNESSINVQGIIAEIARDLRGLGTTATGPVRELRRRFSKRLAAAPAADVVAVGLGLLDLPGFEHRFVGYELICHHGAALASLRGKELKGLGKDLDSWVKVDTFACYLAGPAWREGQISDTLVHRWARSEDRWWRRTALVCTVALNNRARGGRGDVGRTLEVCGMLLEDRDDMVVKAMSWALRELAKHHPDAAAGFMERHRDLMAPRVVRELTHKLRTGLKNPRR